MRYLLSDIADICGGKFVGCDVEVRSIATDSRSLSCEMGDNPLFVAMRGANHDSHEYIEQMRERGVKAFIVERQSSADLRFDGCGFVCVDTAIDALQSLAAHHRSQFKGCVVGITGSNAKTVIKEWISEVIPPNIKSYRSPKSYNSQLGVPLSILMLEGDEDIAIIEAGISQPREMERLERMIKPDVVIFTSIGDAHQENFETVEQKCSEKIVLAKGASKIVYHSFYEPLTSIIVAQYADRKLVDASHIAEVSPVLICNDATRRNAQIVAAFCEVMGYPEPEFQHAPSLSMRLEVKDGINNSVLVNDAYNLDLNSLALALDYLHTIALGRKKTLILSDIRQSGLSDKELYARVADMVLRAGIDTMIGIGEHIKRYSVMFTCRTEFYTTTDDYIRRVNRRDIADRAVLLKGSRDFRFERLAHALERKSHTTVLEVDLDAMIDNLNYFRSRLEFKTKLVAMVKAGGYGTGNFEVAQMLQHQGVDYLAVAFTDEGVLLRERGITLPIVVLNADADSFEQMIANRLEPEIYSSHSLESFISAVGYSGESRYPIHIKLDTGMHRLGFVESEIDELNNILSRERSVKVATIFSHLSCADMPEEDDFTHEQIALFDKMSSRVMTNLDYVPLRHIANSAGIERFPEAQFDMCRLGLGLYGFGFEHNDNLRPVATLKTRIVQIKHLTAGDAVGYGRAAKLMRDTVSATIPIGYADGVDRRLGCGNWSVLVGGCSAPILGRVCMDSCMIDITGIEAVSEGDEVVVFSSIHGNTIEDMADGFGTIPYEIMTSISERVKRIYLKE